MTMFDFVLWAALAGAMALAVHLAIEMWWPNGTRQLPAWVRESIGVGLVLVLSGMVLWRYQPDGMKMYATIAAMFTTIGAVVGVAHLIGWGQRERKAGAESLLKDLHQ